MNCGKSSGWFPFKRGIRQSCPISPFLFVMAVEKLADVVRANNNIRGHNLLDTHTKLLQFADDSTIFVEDEESLLKTLNTIESFKSVSGLGLNLTKSQGLLLRDITLALSIPWGNQLKVLGINFTTEEYEHKDWHLNFLPVIQKLDRVCSRWRLSNSFLKGRVVVLNSLVLPIIFYQSKMLPVPPRVFREVDSIVTSFIWRGKKAKISKHCLGSPTQSGDWAFIAF